MVGTLCFSILAVFCGCSNKQEISEAEIVKLGEETSMIEQTYEIAEQVNAESDLLGIELLGIEPSDAKEGETISLADGSSNYTCVQYVGKSRITQIVFMTEKPNLFGISVGDKVSSLKDKLTEIGFEKISDEGAKLLTTRYEKAVIYQKAYVSLQFYVVKYGDMNGDANAIAELDITEDMEIRKIVIDVLVPQESKFTY